MPTYHVDFHQRIVVTAENIAQARKLTRQFRLIPGAVYGSARGQHDRDLISYAVKPNGKPRIAIKKET